MKRTIRIVSIKEIPAIKRAFIQYVKDNWQGVEKVVCETLEKSLEATGELPLTFILLKEETIIGFYQLIEQEFVLRKDLSPWISPLFIDEKERGKQLGSKLLEHGRMTTGKLGYKKVYLTTDHIKFYEKYGFREIGLDKFVWGRPTKIYEHDTILDSYNSGGNEGVTI